LVNIKAWGDIIEKRFQLMRSPPPQGWQRTQWKSNGKYVFVIHSTG
jgi:hypothetical protein